MDTERDDDSDATALSVITHREFCGTYPENTLAAFEAAAGNDGPERDRADVIELDTRPCADGTPVVFHDTRLDRLTDREGFVRGTPAKTMLRTEVLDSGRTVPII